MNPPRVIEIGDLVLVPGHEPSDGVLSLKKYPLITYEKALLSQATGGKFPSVTFLERKKMSTKTSFKRIALVAASALAIAGFSAVPSNAAVTTMDGVTNKSSSDFTAASFGNLTNTNGAAAFTVSAALAQTDIGKALYTSLDGYIGTISTLAADGLSGTFSAVTTSVTLAGVAAYLGVLPTTTVATGITTGQISGMTVTAGKTVALNIATTGTPAAGEKFRAKYVSTGAVAGTSAATTAVATQLKHIVTFTAPATAGTYPMVIEHSVAGTFATAYPNADRPFADYSFTLTVSASSGLSTALSTVYMDAEGAAASAGATTYNATSNAIARTGSKTLNTLLASVEVTLKNADGTANTATPTVTASIAGSGFVSVTSTAGTNTPSARVATGSASATGLAYVHVGADGSAGTGTVTVSVTDPVSLATTTLGTFTVVSYGTVTKLAVAATNFTIGRTGGYTTGAASATRTATQEVLGALDHTTVVAGGTGTTVPAFVVKATDSSGNAVTLANAGVPTIVSSDATVISGGTCVRDTGSTTYGSSTNGVGYYNCSFTTAFGSVSGKSATLTIRFVDPAGDGTTYLTTTQVVTVGGVAKSEAITTDSSSYTAGGAMTITITAKDASGNPVYDGAESPAITASKAVGGTLPAASFYVAGKVSSDSSTGVKTVFAPAIGGDFLLTATGTDAASTALSATASVEGDQASSLALDAANAATDAANNAYDEAQNATQAASDALAAVTALSAQVSALIATVKSLAAMVAKIKAKVKA